MEKLSKSLFLGVSLLIMVLGTFSCDDMSKEPRANPARLSFDAQGGEGIVEMTNLKTLWTYSGLFTRTINSDSTLSHLKEINPEEITLEALGNGMQQVHYDWVTFQYPKSKKYVKVVVAPNKSKKMRIVHFMTGTKLGASDITVTQLGLNDR